MAFWLFVAVLGVLSTAVLGWGALALARRVVVGANPSQVADYRHQIAEIDADFARGILVAEEAESLRAEVARRLLSVASPAAPKARPATPGFGLVSALAVPLFAFAIYAQVGSPALPDLPQSQRLANAEKDGDLEAMVYKVERHLASNPGDAAGWNILIPSYQGMGRFGDAAFAYQRIIAIKGPSAELLANVAEMLLLQGNGLMPKEGADAAVAALALDPKNSKARYYEALALAQDGKTADALVRFENLLAQSPAAAPYRVAVEREIAKLKLASASAPQLNDDQVAAAQGMSTDEQQQMIRGMVDGLAEKLKTDPKNLEGWLRLIRARVVLKDMDAAKGSVSAARAALAGDSASTAQIEALAKDLKL